MRRAHTASVSVSESWRRETCLLLNNEPGGDVNRLLGFGREVTPPGALSARVIYLGLISVYANVRTRAVILNTASRDRGHGQMFSKAILCLQN